MSDNILLPKQMLTCINPKGKDFLEHQESDEVILLTEIGVSLNPWWEKKTKINVSLTRYIPNQKNRLVTPI